MVLRPFLSLFRGESRLMRCWQQTKFDIALCVAVSAAVLDVNACTFAERKSANLQAWFAFLPLVAFWHRTHVYLWRESCCAQWNNCNTSLLSNSVEMCATGSSRRTCRMQWRQRPSVPALSLSRESRYSERTRLVCDYFDQDAVISRPLGLQPYRNAF